VLILEFLEIPAGKSARRQSRDGQTCLKSWRRLKLSTASNAQKCFTVLAKRDSMRFRAESNDQRS
jgi:hypothetical protein